LEPAEILSAVAEVVFVYYSPTCAFEDVAFFPLRGLTIEGKSTDLCKLQESRELTSTLLVNDGSKVALEAEQLFIHIQGLEFATSGQGIHAVNVIQTTLLCEGLLQVQEVGEGALDGPVVAKVITSGVSETEGEEATL
jgi:hypothetical protein